VGRAQSLSASVSDQREGRSRKRGRFSSYAQDTFIAPGVSTFNTAEIPDMSRYDSESSHWVADLFLNSMFRGRWEPPANAYVYNYVRRAEAAFSEHALAREATLKFLANEGQSPSLYAAAVLHWEFFLGQSWQGYALLARLASHSGGEPRDTMIFARGDGSIEERLNKLYNAMKHEEKRIAAGQILEGATVPVWLTNEGIQSTDAFLMFGETAEILRDVAKWANIVVDPREMAEKLQADD
jgi:hypothetical protein